MRRWTRHAGDSVRMTTANRNRHKRNKTCNEAGHKRGESLAARRGDAWPTLPIRPTMVASRA